MKDMNEEEMQKMFEDLQDFGNERSSTNDSDLNTYSALFEALKKEPEIPLRYNFAARVTEAIQTRKDRANYIRLYALMTFGFVVLLLAVILYLSNLTNAPSSQLLQLLVRYKWIIVFGGILLLLIQVLDRRLLDRRLG